MSEDQILRIGSCVLQHGPSNNRVYLMKLSRAGYPQVMERLSSLARDGRYTKIFAKVPPWALDDFAQQGYLTEAVVPGFYHGREPAYFMALYLDPARAESHDAAAMQQIQDYALAQPLSQPLSLPAGLCLRILSPQDALEMTLVYRQVFQTYPFPIFSQDYIRQTMEEDVIYFGIYAGGALVAISSCEVDPEYQHAEMTDFATLPDYRAKGLASFLLQEMEGELTARGILTAFTIARALSFGMNLTFSRQGYQFGGRLINNTNIGEGIESMNVWHKRLSLG